jgi:hypothetical protein
MAVMYHHTAVDQVGVCSFNFEVVDMTVRTQSAVCSIASRFENLNTVHPQDSNRCDNISS